MLSILYWFLDTEDIDDYSVTEEESSSSSNPYEIHPYILELHEVSKEAPEQVKKVKKTKKKKKIRYLSFSTAQLGNYTMSQKLFEKLRKVYSTKTHSVSMHE